ncbi:unnamed protein product, partial [Dibothriocephalus latus]
MVDNTTEWLGDQFTRLHLQITNEYDWTMEGFAERARVRMLARNKQRQMISTERIQHLGLDLAVAHMICDLGGRVQFVGSDRWFQRYNQGPSGLPNCYVGDLKLEAIDASGTPIMYEGFKFFSELTELRYLRLRRCVHVNDHCLSLVGLITKSPLQLLDINREFVCLLLEDYLPKVYIEGVDYLGQLSDEQRQRVLSISAPDPVPLLEQHDQSSDSDQ